ncbi:MAG: type II toxin-antitoxin system RelE/ParE family toxin [Anaerolineae bacterium]|nr:type II toxin-antitoxin system RelE/ParE family toxin [Anaerolineae bacterium]
MNPPVRVDLSARFRRDVKRLSKKYRRVRHDVEDLIQQLEQGETPGNQVQGTRYTVYKVRVHNSDMPKGKSGGYRVIYYVQTMSAVVLITMYIKSERADISDAEIRRLIDEFEA